MKIYKKILLVLFFLLSVVFFGVLCRSVYSDYTQIFNIIDNLTSLFIPLFLSLLLYTISVSLLALFLRPCWLLLATFILSGIIILLFIAADPYISLAILAVYTTAGILFFRAVNNDIKSRINFSVRSANKGRGLLLSVVVLIFCLSFGLGYEKEAERGGYLIPPDIEDIIIEEATRFASDNIDMDELSPQEREEALEEAKNELRGVIAEAEDNFRDRDEYLWLAPALILSFGLNIFQFFINLLAQGVLSLAFFISQKLKKDNKEEGKTDLKFK